MYKQISTKQKITLSLDMNVYLKLKTNDINASALINEYLIKYLELDKEDEHLEKELKEKKREVNILEYELNKRLEEKATQMKKAYSDEAKAKNKIIASVPTDNSFQSQIKRAKMFKEYEWLEEEMKKGDKSEM